MTRFLLFAAMLLLALSACVPSGDPTATPTVQPTSTVAPASPTAVVVVVTATATPEAVPTTTTAPTPTNTPGPTPTPHTIIVTATSTPTAEPTSTPMPTPTATPHPNEQQEYTGRGATITDAFNLIPNRPVRVTVEHDPDDHFGVYMRFTGSCVRPLLTGTQVYWRHPSSKVCEQHVWPARNLRLEVIARAETDWSVQFDMSFQDQLYSPQDFEGTGSDVMPPVVINSSDVIAFDWTGGEASLDFMRRHTGDGYVVEGYESSASEGHHEWVFGGDGQTYMPYVEAEPGVEWTVEIR